MTSGGKAKRILTGSCSDSGPYVWGGFDAMRILPRKYNDAPSEGSRPLSAKTAGFVPGSGAGALVLESLESALERNATIYAEVLGGSVNSGGQRNGGSMTAPNASAVQRCIKEALAIAEVKASEIDYINAHGTSTPVGDVGEVEAVRAVFEGIKQPVISSTKSMTGHSQGATGAQELGA